jgi:hypothetical protein
MPIEQQNSVGNARLLGIELDMSDLPEDNVPTKGKGKNNLLQKAARAGASGMIAFTPMMSDSQANTQSFNNDVSKALAGSDKSTLVIEQNRPTTEQMLQESLRQDGNDVYIVENIILTPNEQNQIDSRYLNENIALRFATGSNNSDIPTINPDENSELAAFLSKADGVVSTIEQLGGKTELHISISQNENSEPTFTPILSVSEAFQIDDTILSAGTLISIDNNGNTHYIIPDPNMGNGQAEVIKITEELRAGLVSDLASHPEAQLPNVGDMVLGQRVDNNTFGVIITGDRPYHIDTGTRIAIAATPQPQISPVPLAPEVSVVEVPESVEFKNDYLSSYQKLPDTLQERVGIDVNWDDDMGGFVNSDGEVFRDEIDKGISEQDIDNRWMIEMDRETLNLIDKDGRPFVWTVTLERVANYTIGRSESENVEFTQDFRENIANYASQFLDGSALDGKTLRISFAAKYEKNPEMTATQHYMQEVRSLPNGQTFVALGYNRTENGDIHTRVYNGIKNYKLQERPGVTDEIYDEVYTSYDIDNIMTMVVRSQNGISEYAEVLLRPGEDINRMQPVLIPISKQVTGDYLTSTTLVDYS